MSNLDTIIKDLVIANRILAKEDVVDAYGHVSIRNPDNPKSFFISRSLAPELIEKEDIVELGLDGEPLKNEKRSLYLERFIHAAIYETRPDINSVVHAHAEDTLPFGIAAATKQAKSYLAEAKRLGKKRTTLLKRKKSAAARLKKTTNADNRKAHKAIEKELTAVKKAIAKLTPVKSAHAIELASLKTTQKRINAYTGVLDKADKLLNKPKKKKPKNI